MADQITASAAPSTARPIHPEGQFVAQCVDVIDLGEKLRAFADKPPRLTPMCALVFRTGARSDDTGDYIDVSQEFAVSMSDKANLRKFLEAWRGKKYTQEQAEQGVPLHKLESQFALVTIAHSEPTNDRVYANITSCVGVPEQMRAICKPYTGYARAEWWGKRKQEYADAAGNFRKANAANGATAISGAPALDPDDPGF